MKRRSIGMLVVAVAVLLFVIPASGWAGQHGKPLIDNTLIEKAVNPIGLSTETRKAERFKAENKANVSDEFFEGIRDIWIGLLHPAKFAKDVGTLEAKPAAGKIEIDNTLIEKAVNPIGLSTEARKAERFKAENKANVSDDFFEGIRDIWIGLLHPAKFGSDLARMPKTK
ncbi:MAG: hypothetical protein O6916_07495 [bacterium]|nr:hypothetical protein [bacterium]MCZ6701072.1 hypothetical protein [bacterium]